MPVAAHKHTALEQVMADLARAQMRTEANLSRTEANLDRLEANLDRYTAEMRAGQAETKANLDRLSTEMREFKDEMRASTSRSEKEWKEFRKMLGDEAHKRGRLVEDILVPSVPDLFKQLTGWQGDVTPGVRQWRGRHGDPSQMREFDLVAWAGDYFLLLEAKSTLGADDINDLIETIETIRDYFPEASQRRVLAGLTSFYMDPSIVTALERRKLLAVGLSGGLAEVLNSPGFKPTEF